MPRPRAARDDLPQAEEDPGSDRSFIQGLAKGLAVIQTFNDTAQAMTLSQVSEKTGLSRAAVRRVLMTLEKLGFALKQDERYFALTPRVLSLGYAYLSSMPLWVFAEPILETLVEDVRETCSLSVLDDTDAVYVLRIPIHRILNQGVTVGSRLPAYCCSHGRVLLSGLTPAQLDSYFRRARFTRYTDDTVVDRRALEGILSSVLKKGYAWASGEMQASISGLSVPVQDADGHVIAAVNISVNRANQSEGAFVKANLPMLKRAAARLNSSLVIGQSRQRRARKPRQ